MSEKSEPQKSVIFRMLTPLIRVEIKTKEKITFELNSNLKLIINDNSIFKTFNQIKIGTFQQEHFSGMAAMSFNYSPLILGEFPIVKDYLDYAERVLDNLLNSLALFKTTDETQLKAGPKIVYTFTEKGLVRGTNIRVSDHWAEFKGKNYPLEMEELETFKQFFNNYEKIILKISDKRIQYGIDFFAKASRTADITEKFIFLSLTLEILFSRESNELVYRFSNRIALLLGTEVGQREAIRELVKKIYNKRSSLFHGSSFKSPSKQEFSYLYELIRSSILQFLALIENGISDPVEILDSFILKQNTEKFQNFQNLKSELFGGVEEFRYVNIKEISEIKF